MIYTSSRDSRWCYRYVTTIQLLLNKLKQNGKTQQKTIKLDLFGILVYSFTNWMLYNPPKMKSENRKQPVNHPPPPKKSGRVWNEMQHHNSWPWDNCEVAHQDDILPKKNCLSLYDTPLYVGVLPMKLYHFGLLWINIVVYHLSTLCQMITNTLC